MKNVMRKSVLAAVVLMCLAPLAFAGKPNNDRRCDPRRRNCHQVPEGGSALVYVLGAGLTCVGAMVVRARSVSVNHS